MRKIFLPLLLALMAALARPPAAGPAEPAAEDRTFRVTVETSAGLSGGTQKARDSALKSAKTAAVRNYLALRVPAEILEARATEVSRILGAADSYVISWEILSESEREGKLFLRVEVLLNRQKLEAALKSAGLVPARPLPSLLITAACNPGNGELPRGWQKNSGAVPNFCEAALGRTLEKYGFQILKPAPEMLSADPIKLLDPASRQQAGALYQEMVSRLAAGAMIAARFTLGAGAAGAPYTVSYQVMLLDLGKGEMIWTNQQDNLQAKAGTDRNRLLAALAADQAEKCAAELYRRLSFSSAPAGGAEIILSILNFSSYPVMKEFERRMKTEGPGITSMTISRLAPGEVEYTLRTSADPVTLANWVIQTRPAGLTYKLVEIQGNRVTIRVEK